MEISSGRKKLTTGLADQHRPNDGRVDGLGSDPEECADALPRISVLTPSHNGAPLIAEAIDSVLRQRYPDLEHLVLDACSTDGTLDVLARYPHLTVISELDDGPHDAMNRGVMCANGEIIGFLNADDFYPEQRLLEIGQIFKKNPGVEVVVGRCIYFEDSEHGERRIMFERPHARQNGLWLPELLFGSPGINGCFFRRRLFDRIGKFENSYNFAADKHFLIRATLAGVKSIWLNAPTIYYRIHAGSRTLNPERRNLMAIGEELFRMAPEFSSGTRDRRPEHQIFLAWHAFEGAKLLLRHSLHGQFSDTFRVFSKLLLLNPFWPFRLPRALMLCG